MRDKILYALAAFVGIIILWNLNIIMNAPDEMRQGPVFRIMFFHIPAAVMAGLSCFGSVVFSILYLWRKDLKYDAAAVSATEIGLAFGAIVLITGSIWGRGAWGVWWAWDARLTSTLVTWLVYAGYLMLRRAIDEPTQRARFAAVVSILAFPGVIITYKSIEWWQQLQHPSPVFESRGGGGFGPYLPSLMWNMLAMTLLGTVLFFVRHRQETSQRELDALRRTVHSF